MDASDDSWMSATAFPNYFLFYGSEVGTPYEHPQPIDTFPVYFIPIGKDPVRLAEFWKKAKGSIRRLSKMTGHSRFFLRQQFRKFGIRNS